MVLSRSFDNFTYGWLLQVWLGPYIEHFYATVKGVEVKSSKVFITENSFHHEQPWLQAMSAGPGLEEREALRENLKCKDFKW